MNEKGGVLGRQLELVVHDDGSDPATAVRLYEQLITRDKVDLVLGPHGGSIADPVADVTEKHKMPMVAPVAAATSIYRKGQKTVALISTDDIGSREVIQGAINLAKKKGLQVVFADAYPVGTTDFSAILTKVRAANPDVLGVATSVFEDGVAITRRMASTRI